MRRASRSEQQDVVSPHSTSVLHSCPPIMHGDLRDLTNETCASNKTMNFTTVYKYECLTFSSLQSHTKNVEVQTVPLSSSETAFGAPSELVIAHRRKKVTHSSHS